MEGEKMSRRYFTASLSILCLTMMSLLGQAQQPHIPEDEGFPYCSIGFKKTLLGSFQDKSPSGAGNSGNYCGSTDGQSAVRQTPAPPSSSSWPNQSLLPQAAPGLPSSTGPAPQSRWREGTTRLLKGETGWASPDAASGQ